MKYFFHPEAETELLIAIDYYEECQAGLGFDFSIEVRSTIETILSFPKAWPVLEADICRCQLRRFPYGIIYASEADTIHILAVMHLRREPDYWKDRIIDEKGRGKKSLGEKGE